MPHNVNEWLMNQSQERRNEIYSKAGKAAQAKQRRHRAMREVLQQLMSMDTTNEAMRDLLQQLGLEPTNDNAVSLAQIVNACKGETEAARFVRDTMGEKPTEQYNLGLSGKPIKSLDLSKLSDAELEALADQTDEA